MSTHPPTLTKPPVAAASGTDHDALPAGTRFGEFEILRVLGVGGFGIVYLARDHSLEREVALKEYMPASLAARGAGPQITVRSSSFAETYAIGLRSFINEARLLARFDHPSLVKVYRFWEDNATAYMVMPFLQGTTLRDTRRGMAHPPDEAWIRSVITPILSALELLHREGVYHRDIAPDNILLPRDGPPVLLDFGAARRVISDRTQSLTAILKPSYAPIEQYAEMTQLRQGPWTDLYALGAVVHYLVFGVPPAPATARAVAEDGDAIENRVVPGISPRFLEAMSWMLAVRPNQRPQSGEQLRAVLDGHAEIPPRGRPGMTIPGALAPAASGAQIEQAADATRINSAYVPTQMPTPRVGAAPTPATTTYSPTAPMPTARATPAARPPAPAQPQPPQAQTQRPPAQPQRAPSAGPAGARHNARPRRFAVGGAQRTALCSVGTRRRTVAKPAAPARAAAAPSQPAGFAASRPATLPPSASGPQTRPPGAQSPSSRPAPLAAQASSRVGHAGQREDRSSGPCSPAAAAIVVLAAAAALQFAGQRGTTVAGATGPASRGCIEHRLGACDRSRAPLDGADRNDHRVVLGQDRIGRRRAGADADPGSGEGSRSQDRTIACRLQRRHRRSPRSRPAADAAASAARMRPAGKPVPRVDDPASAVASNPNQTPDIRVLASAADPADGDHERKGPVAREPTPAPRAVEPAAPATAREACASKQGFFAFNICLDERCEEARFRNVGDCPAVLARKHQRQR